MDDEIYEEEQSLLDHDEEIRASDYRSLITNVDNGNDFASISSHVVSLGRPVVHGPTRVWAECTDYHPHHNNERDVLRVSMMYDPDLDDVVWRVSTETTSFSTKEKTLFTGSYTALVNRLLGKE